MQQKSEGTPGTGYNPYGPGYVYTSADSYDNAHGANPLSTIRGTPIKNVNLSLTDLNGNSSGYTNQVILSFSSDGVLSASALIDASAFDVNRVGAYGNMGMNGYQYNGNVGIDPWSRQQQMQQYPQNNRLVTYRAYNISYAFDSNSGTIRIWNFIAGSNVGQNSNYSNMGMQPGQYAQSRLAIQIGGTSVRSKSYLGGFVNVSTSFSSKNYFEGRLMNLATGYSMDGSDYAVAFNPSNAGFKIRSQISLSSGEIISTPSYNNNYYPGPNGYNQPTQTTLDQYMPNQMKNSFLYAEPVLDPRI